MSLQDEIQNLRQMGDPQKVLIDYIQARIETEINNYANELYTEICKKVAAKTVYGLNDENYIPINTDSSLYFNPNESVWKNYYYTKREPIHTKIQDLKDDYDSGNLYYLMYYDLISKSTKTIKLTRTGERLIAILADLCRKDGISIRPKMLFAYNCYGGKTISQITEVGGRFHPPLFRGIEHLSNPILVVFFDYDV